MIFLWAVMIFFLEKFRRKLQARMEKEAKDAAEKLTKTDGQSKPKSDEPRPLPKLPDKNCPPHKWDYDVNGFMYCKLCKRRPGFADGPAQPF